MLKNYSGNKIANLEALDPDNNSFHLEILTHLQGNILQGYECNYTVYIFVKFPETEAGVEQTKAWLRNFAQHQLTSAKQQWERSHQQPNHLTEDSLYTNLFLSGQGYIHLFLKEEEMRWGTNQFWESLFEKGLKQLFFLDDPRPETWEPRFRDRIDAVISLGHNEPARLEEGARTIINEINKFATVLNLDVGYHKKSPKGEVIEHFGFRDGISQPLFFQEELDMVGATDRWDPRAPLGLVLVEEEDLCGNGQYGFGSYAVYRKLEQNVPGFKAAVREFAGKLELVGQEGEEKAAALLVGRYKDGTPLMPIRPEDAGTDPNNFNYNNDIEGLICPFQAHMRKTNPRGDLVARRESAEGQRLRRIARRGLSYWETPALQQPQPDEDFGQLLQRKMAVLTEKEIVNQHPIEPSNETDKVGLLFLCFQHSIFNQFLHIHATWSDNDEFARPGAGIDPIISQKQAAGQWWRKENGQRVRHSFSHFVTMTGGEFLFAPSLPFLQNLK